MKLVVIESPYAGDVARNVAYAHSCIGDSLKRGEAPFASHVLYTQALDDTIGDQRAQGVAAGFAWGERCELVAVYTDLGISGGMLEGIGRAQASGQPIEYRKLGGW